MSKERELQLGMRCVKYMIFVANFMFMLVGFLLISIGYTIKSIYTDFDAFLVSNSYKASDLAVAVGVIILIVALFGCVGAMRESVCLVNTYSLCLLIIVILEISISITAYSSRTNLRTTLKQDMYTSMNYYDQDTNYIWSATQYTLQCCGVVGPNDWRPFANNIHYNLSTIRSDSQLSQQLKNTSETGTTDSSVIITTDMYYYYTVPNSCCRQENCTDMRSLYTGGCLPKLTFIISQSALLLGVGAMCITFIQLLGAIFAHLLARSIRKLKTQIEVEKNLRRQQLYEQLSKSNTQEKVSPVLYIPSSSEA